MQVCLSAVGLRAGAGSDRDSARVRKSAQTLVAFAIVAMASSAFAQEVKRAESPPASYIVVGDAIPEPLGGASGDAARGRAIVASRQTGLCLLCHSAPIPEERFQGDLAPSLAGAGSRWSAGQLRLRLADGKRLNPDSIMPSYYRTEGLNRVGAAWKSKPVLSAQQIEDVIAYVLTLR